MFCMFNYCILINSIFYRNDEVTLHCSKVSSSITTISGSENIKSSYDSKPHCFTLKRNFIRVNCGCCDCCIRFGVILAKCSRSYFFLFFKSFNLHIGCKGTFHESCRNKAPLPCITRVETPKAYSNLKGRRLRLGDYCPDTRPMIPPLIAYCVHFLEKNSVTCDLYNNLGYFFFKKNLFFILEVILKLNQLQNCLTILAIILS